MASEDDAVADEELVLRLSHRPYETQRGMIRLSETPRSTPVRTPASSSIGDFERLPPEVLHAILNWVDFLSLCRFALTSVRANNIVHTLPAYRDLFLHAPAALGAFGRTRLLTYHSAGRIRAALRCEKCVYCNHFGPYLFLPTCERCCWHCLENNPSLWVVSRGVAARCFSLTSAELDQLPTLLSVPGEYCVGHEPKLHVDRQKLVSVQATKKLAISIHGSEAEISRLATKIPRISQKRLSQYKHYHGAQLDPPKIESSAQPAGKLDATAVHDPFPGMGSISFPVVAYHGVEDGLWCKGCDELLQTHAMRFFPTHSEPVPMWTLFMSMRRRSYSRAQFLNHIKTCYGIQLIAARSGLEGWSRRVHDTDAPPRTLAEVVSSLLKPSVPPGHNPKDDTKPDSEKS